MEKMKPIENKDFVFNSDNTATWVLRSEGEVGGTHNGTFVFKCFLNPTDILAKGRVLRELLGSNATGVTETEYSVAFALAELSKRVVKSPPFWSSTLQNSAFQGDIPDLPVLLEVLDASLRAESLYKQNLADRKAEALKKSNDAAKAIQERLNAKPEIDNEKEK